MLNSFYMPIVFFLIRNW